MAKLKKIAKSLSIYLSLVILTWCFIYYTALHFGQQTLHIAKKQWFPAKASDQGIDPQRLQRAAEYIDARLPLARGLIILRNGKTILEKYYWKGGPQEPEYLHSLNSIVLHTLLGIAIDNQLISSKHQPISDFFPQMLSNQKEDHHILTVNHLLNFQAPFIWGNNNSEYWQFFYSQNRISASISILRSAKNNSHPLSTIAANYLLATIIEKVTADTVFNYAQNNLFKPLGITTYSKENHREDQRDSFIGFRLKTLDLAKIGFLYMKKGNWQGLQIVSSQWIETISGIENDLPVGTFRGGWQTGIFDDKKTYIISGDGGQFVLVSPEFNLVIALSSTSRFPLPLISGYKTLFEMIMNSANEISDPEQSGLFYNDPDSHVYHKPNFILTTDIPSEIRQFFLNFAEDIATNDIKKVAFHYAKGYWKSNEGFKSIIKFWIKIFNGGTGELESVQIKNIRIDKNRVYLRGLLKYSYYNMNEGSLGWFPIENMIKLNGRWLLLGSPEFGDILDRDEYFDAEIPDDISLFLSRCEGVFTQSSLPEKNNCFKDNLDDKALSALQLTERIKPYCSDHDTTLHITAVEGSGIRRKIKGYIGNCRIGDIRLPPSMAIELKDEQWRWSVNESF